MGKFYIINAPWGFSTVWSLVKGWLDEATVAKIHVLGSDYKKSLLEQVPADSLPEFLGGSCQCPEGCSLSDAGPWHGKSTRRTRALSSATNTASIKSTKPQQQPTQQAQVTQAQSEISQDQFPVETKTPLVPAATNAVASNGDPSKY